MALLKLKFAFFIVMIPVCLALSAAFFFAVFPAIEPEFNMRISATFFAFAMVFWLAVIDLRGMISWDVWTDFERGVNHEQ